MLDVLVSIDHELLRHVNGWAGNSTIDSLMILISGKWIWIPLYAFLLYKLKMNFGLLQVGWTVLAICVTVVLTDQGSVALFKESFQRLRPCHNLALKDSLQLVTGKCGGQFGFISSHAANVFGLASFCSVLFRERFALVLFLLAWASTVSVSRVYLGVHYPSDVIGGMLFGATVGCTMALLTLQTIKNK